MCPDVECCRVHGLFTVPARWNCCSLARKPHRERDATRLGRLFYLGSIHHVINALEGTIISQAFTRASRPTSHLSLLLLLTAMNNGGQPPHPNPNYNPNNYRPNGQQGQPNRPPSAQNTSNIPGPGETVTLTSADLMQFYNHAFYRGQMAQCVYFSVRVPSSSTEGFLDRQMLNMNNMQ